MSAEGHNNNLKKKNFVRTVKNITVAFKYVL